jgi:PIN domain nuclease of toxin-antitoxin system
VRVLIDTQIIIWLATGLESPLTPTARRCFAQAEELFLSIVSYWEISIKRGIKKLRWNDRESEAFERGLRENQIQEMAVRRAHCDRIMSLPQHHRDPFDRMLIAQAQVEDMAVLTADRRFRRYDIKVVW